MKSIIKYFILLTVLISCKEEPVNHTEHASEIKIAFTCPMHPEIIRNEPGKCPVCGMNLEKVTTDYNGSENSELTVLLNPTNQFVISSVPVTVLQNSEEYLQTDALGFVSYDMRQTGTISSRISGRIEKLYVKYKYQPIAKGQKIMDIYSPELLTAQQAFLYVLKKDAENKNMINASMQRLLLAGINQHQINQIMKTGKPLQSISIYSNYSGHIQETENSIQMQQQPAMPQASLQTELLSLKEGMYVQKGQAFLSVFNAAKAWIVLNIYSADQGMVKKGSEVAITPEAYPAKKFRAKLNYIEPFYRPESKTLSVRIYFDNSVLKLPIGSQVKAKIFGRKSAKWLPESAVLTLGADNVVFVKNGDAFQTHSVKVGTRVNEKIEIISGLTASDSVAVNAEFLMDSESFIKVNN